MLDEIKKMGKTLMGGEEELTTETPNTDTPKTDAPGTSVPTTEIPIDTLETDTPSTNTPVTSTPTTEIPDESATLKAELELLRNEVEKLKSPTPTNAPTTEASIDEENFMKELDFDTITSNPEEFNKLLNLVYKKGVLAARDEVKNGSKEVIKTLPNLISDNISVIQTLEKVSNDFYSDNEDLKPYKENVAIIFGEIASANLDKTYTENLSLTGDEVRKRLNLTKPETKPETKPKPPKLPTNKGNKRSNQTEPKGIADELAAMNKALGI